MLLNESRQTMRMTLLRAEESFLKCFDIRNFKGNINQEQLKYNSSRNVPKAKSKSVCFRFELKFIKVLQLGYYFMAVRTHFALFKAANFCELSV